MKLYYAVVVILFLAVSCSMQPESFVRTNEPGWSSMEIMEGLDENEVWEIIVDVIARNFEIEMMSKDSGYLRTRWSYTWSTGQIAQNYRVRILVKTNYRNRTVDIRSEANYLYSSQWIQGSDTRLLQTIKTDIAGRISRTAF